MGASAGCASLVLGCLASLAAADSNTVLGGSLSAANSSNKILAYLNTVPVAYDVMLLSLHMTWSHGCWQLAAGPGYRWWQSEEEVCMEVAVGPQVSAQQVVCQLKTNFLAVKVNGHSVLEGALHRPIAPDDSSWQLGKQHGCTRYDCTCFNCRPPSHCCCRGSALGCVLGRLHHTRDGMNL